MPPGVGVLRPWLAALIIGVALIVCAGIAALAGRGEVKKATPPMPSLAADSVKADVEQIKGVTGSGPHTIPRA